MAGNETSRMSFGTLYDVNKMMYEKMSPMSAEDFQNYMINISLWFSKNNFQYFMFLCLFAILQAIIYKFIIIICLAYIRKKEKH